MKRQSKTTAVNGGTITRDGATGRLREVRVSEPPSGTSGVSRVSPISETVVRDVSARRSEALRRLADR